MFRRGEKLDQGIMFVVQWPTKGGVNEGKNVFFLIIWRKSDYLIICVASFVDIW